MISTVIFDIGNVLTAFGWREFIKSFGYSEDICKRIGDATIENEDWAEFDRGVLSNEQMQQLFYENDPEIVPQIKETMQCFTGILKPCDYAIPWIRELKSKGLKVLFLSNFSDRAFNECQDALSFLPYVDGGIFSYRVKLIKPDVRIYERIVDEYNLIPNQCVFIDDLAENCEAARTLGINTIQFMGYEDAKEKLDKLLQ
ncbi:MAG: HAD family phosphatase [Lachnospiraceae bacterium]|nr:HAD family phosphatase [Candidatus Colinaster equi]